VVVDTAVGEVHTLSDAPGIVAHEPETLAEGSTMTVPSRSLLVLQRTD
jgi:glycogen operon protein